ncbi:nitrate reductase [Sulfurisphaera javensis]|uniref:Nitrate reductase n=1 Tax=Sulfurisphaera javensis TaxID=2049879 RepID=A0AAT9GTW6_9CREN
MPENYITNKGMLCIKGSTLLETVNSGRILYPYLDNKEVEWKKALEYTTIKMKRIIRKGKDSLGIYIGAQIPTEDQYLAVKLGKGFIGTASFDSNVRLCMASAAFALKYAFGDPSPTASYDDIDKAETYLLIGVNPASNFPVLWNRMISNKLKRKAKIIVIDPIYTDSAQQADLYVRIPPGKDILLLNSIAYLLIKKNIIRIEPENFKEFKEVVMKYQPERISKIINVKEDTISYIADRIAQSKTLFMWGMGVNQTERAVDTGILISTLAMLTGNVDIEGSGVLPLTGQHNSMGAREAGALAGMLPGLRYVDNEEEVEEVERFWNLPKYSIPRHYYTITEMYKLIEERKIKALWIIGTNPVVSLPQARKFADLLSYLDLVIVQDAYFTETTKFADVIFPALSWGEREGIHTAGDRTVGYLSKILEGKGEARPDWMIIQDVANYLGFEFKYTNIEDIFNEFKLLTKNRIDDISNLTYKELEKGYRWPVKPKIFRTRPVEFEKYDLIEDNEFIVITGRTKGHWNTRTRSSKSWSLNVISDDDYIFLDIEICNKLHIKDGNDVKIITGEGYTVVPAKCVDWIKGNIAFMPFHWGHTNKIMDWKIDRESKEPAYKHLKARIEPFMS